MEGGRKLTGNDKDHNKENKHTFYHDADHNHILNTTIASRMLFLVGLHFSMIEIGHLCVEIHLHDPCMARGRGEEGCQQQQQQPKMNRNPRLKLVPMT